MAQGSFVWIQLLPQYRTHLFGLNIPNQWFTFPKFSKLETSKKRFSFDWMKGRGVLNRLHLTPLKYYTANYKIILPNFSQVLEKGGDLNGRIHLPDGDGRRRGQQPAANGWKGLPPENSEGVTWRDFSLSIGWRHVSVKPIDERHRLVTQPIRNESKKLQPKYLSSVWMSTL